MQISPLIQTRWLFHWRKYYYEQRTFSYFSWKQQFKVNALIMYFFIQTQLFALQDFTWWTGVVWNIVMFLISCLDSHSDGTHSLHSWVSHKKLHFSKFVVMKKQIHLHLEWPGGGNTFSTTFWWTTSFKWMNVFLQLPSLFLFCSYFLHPGNTLPPSDPGRTLSDGVDKAPFSSFQPPPSPNKIIKNTYKIK